MGWEMNIFGISLKQHSRKSAESSSAPSSSDKNIVVDNGTPVEAVISDMGMIAEL